VSTHRSTWKRRERDAARFFGAERQPLSGSGGGRRAPIRPTTGSTSNARCGRRPPSGTSGSKPRDRARKERKTPVLTLFDKGKPGALIVVHQDDLAAVAVELAAQSPSDAHEARPGAVGNGATRSLTRGRRA
jgi:hypothetical protein